MGIVVNAFRFGVLEYVPSRFRLRRSSHPETECVIRTGDHMVRPALGDVGSSGLTFSTGSTPRRKRLGVLIFIAILHLTQASCPRWRHDLTLYPYDTTSPSSSLYEPESIAQSPAFGHCKKP